MVNHIKSILGNLGIEAIISNIGKEGIYDLLWSIDVEGIVFSGGHTTGIISSIHADSEISVKSDFVFGIGPVMITVIAREATKTASSFLLGPFLIRMT